MDNKTTITCPACGKKMTKITVPESNIEVDICLDGCGGIFFDNRELQQVDEPIDNIDEILKAIQNKEFEKVDTTAKRICPLCNIPMVKQGSGTEVEIDSCNICGATFLDNGELTKLRELKNEDGEDIVNEALKKVEASMPKISGKPSGRVTFLQNFITNLLLK